MYECNQNELGLLSLCFPPEKVYFLCKNIVVNRNIAPFYYSYEVSV